MAVQWNNYHVGVDNRGGYWRIFIGRGTPAPNGMIKFSSKSENRTEEIIRAVAEKFNQDITKRNNPDKPFAGYNIPGVGKLVFIKRGYDFSVRPSSNKH